MILRHLCAPLQPLYGAASSYAACAMPFFSDALIIMPARCRHASLPFDARRGDDAFSFSLAEAFRELLSPFFFQPPLSFLRLFLLRPPHC
jgi:hypothetical protein